MQFKDEQNSQDLIEFFLNETEELYEHIQNALEQINSNEWVEGIAALAGPIHTLKGVAGFIQGFEVVGTSAHTLEDFLQLLKKDPTRITTESAYLVVSAVEGLFGMIEKIKNHEKIQPLEINLNALADPASQGPKLQLAASPLTEAPQGNDDFEIRLHQGVLIIKPQITRIHLSSHYTFLESLDHFIPPGQQIVMVMDEVLSMGSQAWGTLSYLATKHQVSVVGMPSQGACQRTYQAFGFEGVIRSFSNEQQFFQMIKR